MTTQNDTLAFLLSLGAIAVPLLAYLLVVERAAPARYFGRGR